MGIRKCSAHTPSRRHMTSSDFKEITKNTPEKSLITSLNREAGRNNRSKIVVRHRGGGNRRKYRIIGFKRSSKDDISVIVIGIRYGLNRTTDIALICYADGEKVYTLVPQDLTNGIKVVSGDMAGAKFGNYMPLYRILVGTQVYNIELYPGRGGQLVHLVGNLAQPMAKEGKYATLHLPSGEVGMASIICRATVGAVGNGKYFPIDIGRTGRKRNMDIRPIVHGSVMSPNDHLHGDGEGKCGIDHSGPRTPWGKPVLGLRIRRKNRRSNKLIVRRHDGRTIKQLKEVKNIWLVHWEKDHLQMRIC